MLSSLLAASLTLAALMVEPPHAEEARHAAAAKAEEPEKPEKPARHKLPSPSVPAEEPEMPRRKVVHRPVVHTPAPAPAPAHVPPAPGSLVPDPHSASLEAEIARLRMQLLPGGSQQITDPAGALRELVSGNQRFVANARVRTMLSTQDGDLRHSLAKSQAPFAVIITCSDSRLADNLIFDQELGRLFTIREAGNSPDVQSLASVEYAVEHLGSKVVVVMGHTSCGAVTAVHAAHGKPLPGNLWALQAAMTGLLESTPEDPNEDAPTHLYHLVVHNAQRQAQAVIDRSDLVREHVARNQLKVVPAVYDLATGKVTFLDAPAPPAAEAPKHH